MTCLISLPITIGGCWVLYSARRCLSFGIGNHPPNHVPREIDTFSPSVLGYRGIREQGAVARKKCGKGVALKGVLLFRATA